MHLLEVLREECGIISAKNGCAPEGACGCCLVTIDGTPALSCLRKPEQTEGRNVVTLEGLPEDVRKRMGEAFVLEGGVQCGFCIPGIVVRAASLIEQGKTGDRAAVAKALDGHLCRCTGYGRILDSIQTAGEAAGGNQSAEILLIQLKQKMGVLPAGAPVNNKALGAGAQLQEEDALDVEIHDENK